MRQSSPAPTRRSRQSVSWSRPLGSDVSASSARAGYAQRMAETGTSPVSSHWNEQPWNSARLVQQLHHRRFRGFGVVGGRGLAPNEVDVLETDVFLVDDQAGARNEHYRPTARWSADALAGPQIERRDRQRFVGGQHQIGRLGLDLLIGGGNDGLGTLNG